MSARPVDSPPLTLGTAGHIDHGKTALIAALTGKDTDRLPEEHRRGISIELGYAMLALPSGRRLSAVDAPGHERFVRTMVAGATGIDMFLLCVAADDGVMPQTREHVAVLRQLGVSEGVVAITKSDVGDAALATEEVAEFLPGVEAVPVSARERAGLDALLAALDGVAARLPGRASGDAAARLHIDRSFTLKGIGTVVTGTLWSGRLARGDPVTILPGDRSARIRSVQVHDEPREEVAAGQRVALNLAGIGWRALGRGDVVVGAGAALEPTYLIDAAIALEQGARPVERGTRVQIHHGTREAPARVVPLDREKLPAGERGYAQLRLEDPLVPAAGDRLVIRQIAPPDTIGGGVVVDPAPRKHRAGEGVVARLAALERGETVPDASADGGGESSGARVNDAGGMNLRERSTDTGGRQTEPQLDDRARAIADLLRSDGHSPRTDAELADAARLAPDATATRLRALVSAGQAVRVARNLHFDAEALAELRSRVEELCERDGEATVAGVRDALGTSRKYAQAVLEHMDATKVTVRRGDAHVLRRRNPMNEAAQRP